MHERPVQIATVLGAGAMGTLCAAILAQRGVSVRLWARSADRARELSLHRENRRYLPGTTLDGLVTVTAHPMEAFADTDLVVSAVPCQYTREAWKTVAEACPRHVPIVSATKGLEVETQMLPTHIIADVLGASGALACLTGPCIAPEAARQLPTSVVVAAEDEDVASEVQHAFSTPSFRVYRHDDLFGVELAAATKNVIAIAAGICDGIEAGCNAKSALITRGLVEITRLGVAMGAQARTFRGLAGMGDLMTTCISPVGRNRSAGERIGRGMSAGEVIASTDSVIEGIPTTRSVLSMARRAGVEMAITEAMASVLFEDTSPHDAIHRLMTRQLQREFR